MLKSAETVIGNILVTRLDELDPHVLTFYALSGVVGIRKFVRNRKLGVGIYD